jgi:hypothetical protein
MPEVEALPGDVGIASTTEAIAATNTSVLENNFIFDLMVYILYGSSMTLACFYTPPNKWR